MCNNTGNNLLAIMSPDYEEEMCDLLGPLIPRGYQSTNHKFSYVARDRTLANHKACTGSGLMFRLRKSG